MPNCFVLMEGIVLWYSPGYEQPDDFLADDLSDNVDIDFIVSD